MRPELRSLAFAVAGALALATIPAAAFAQTAGQQCTDMQMAQHKCGQQSQSKKTDQDKSAQPENKYPNATRKEPKVKGVEAKEAKTLNAGLEAANSGDSAAALKDLQPIADSSKSPYAKALADLGLAQVKYKSGDTKGAIALQKQALDANALPNSNYFQGLESLAQMYIANEDYADALTTLNTWTQQSGAQSADVYALQGDAYYRLQKYPEAVAAIQKAKALSSTPQPSWDQIEMASYFAMDKYDEAAKLADAALAKDPNNSALLQNVIAIYVNSHQDQKALALLERARANGQITNPDEYMNMVKMYDNIALSAKDPTADAQKAVAVLKEGMQKGIVPPGAESYTLMGDSYAVAGDYKNAADAYAKAAPDAKTGEIDFKRGVMLQNLGRHSESRTALQQAIAKGGFQRIGQAYLALGAADLALKDRAGAIAAFKQAEQHASTRADAQQSLKQLGQK